MHTGDSYMKTTEKKLEQIIESVFIVTDISTNGYECTLGVFLSRGRAVHIVQHRGCGVLKVHPKCFSGDSLVKVEEVKVGSGTPDTKGSDS